MMKIFTLAFIVLEERVLLGFKKRGLGSGLWNGFGGKLEAGETVQQAAERETLEECGVAVKDLNQVGRIIFRFEDNFYEPLDVRVFRATEFQGEPYETEEMRPQWFDFADIPYNQMWPDDRFWLPILLKGSHFEASFDLRGMDTIVDYNLKEVPSISQ